VSFKSNHHRWMIGAAALLALGACDKVKSIGGNTTSTATTAGRGDAANSKLDTYTEGYNKLIDTFGLPETMESYVEQKISSKSPTDSISISSGWIGQALTSLKQARALSGGPADLDAAADTLIASLEKVLARLTPLETYYSSKAYREDALARGKREDPLMLAEFKAASEAGEAFNTILSRERRARTEIELTELKKSGNMLAYNTKLALQQAEPLVDLFNKPEDLRDPAVLAKADAIIAALEKTLADQRSVYATAKGAAKTPGDAPDYGYEAVNRELTQMIGDYRDLKQSGEVSDVNDMVRNYNSAIESLNNITR
jgi:hypothetical protein